jgi:hypothetical protein
MSRTGKIARLPKELREQLNRRLDDQEPAAQLAEWLNARPEVQAVLKDQFAGRPISEQNVSDWRNGGFRDWQQFQVRREFFHQTLAETIELDKGLAYSSFLQDYSRFVMADLALAVKEATAQIEDPVRRVECLALLASRLAQFRREESNAARTEMQTERWEEELSDKKITNIANLSLLPALHSTIYPACTPHKKSAAAKTDLAQPVPASTPGSIKPTCLSY